MKSLKERMTETTIERCAVTVSLLPITSKLQVFKILCENPYKNEFQYAGLQPANLPKKNSFTNYFLRFC